MESIISAPSHVGRYRTGETCYHCGQACEETHWSEGQRFCCYGCKTVFEILSANRLCEYYQFDKNPGISLKGADEQSFQYLDEPSVRKKVVAFDSPTRTRVTFHIPAIHCVSCIWLLENLRRMEAGILRSEVNFARKTVTIDINPHAVTVGRVAALLASVGYAPRINLDSEEPVKRKPDRSVVLRLAIAGFCSGNVMLFSFPEYLGLGDNPDMVRLFGYLNLALSIPVFLYSGFGYLTSAWNAFRQKQINIDVPIAVGLLALFFRSAYDVLSGTGPGYFDSFTGLVFFLLIGRWFQSKTYESLSFDRDFKSYFPLAVQRLDGDVWKPVVVHELKKNDTIRVRNMEIVPADTMLVDGEAFIDYSFVTGESRPVKVLRGDTVYAGGRLIGQPVTLVVEKRTSQSHLTSLWNNDAFRKTYESRYQHVIDRAARVFTWVVLLIALGTAVWWQVHAPERVWLVLTSVLMVACPCALALTAPFTYGGMLRVFGRYKFYLKNADVIERLASVDAVVFDKTGTVTHGDKPLISFEGKMTEAEWRAVGRLTGASAHPLSVMISRKIAEDARLNIEEFAERPGQGIEGVIDGKRYRIGSAVFTGAVDSADVTSARVFVSVGDEPKGYFAVRTAVRAGIKPMLTRLGERCVALLSGDNDAERGTMAALFPPNTKLLFNQDPLDKLRHIRSIQQQGKKVLMVGDGLNDSGALRQSHVGLAVTDDTGVFTPACDGIVDGRNMDRLDHFLKLARSSSVILKFSFVISFFYNAIALSVAVAGYLTPLIAAILMPLSSISVVSFVTIAVNLSARSILGKEQ